MKINLNLFRNSSRDIDSPLSMILDSLKGLLFLDDKQIMKTTLVKKILDDKQENEKLIIKFRILD